MSKKVVVTGATGFIGAHLLLELLRGGNTVVALKRTNSSLKQVEQIFAAHNSSTLLEKISWQEADVLHYSSLLDTFSDADVVFHCAAIVSFNPARKKEVIDSNTNGTANVVQACLAKKVPLLCHLSSVAALGKSEGKTVDEDSTWTTNRGQSGYAIGKFFAEMQVWNGAEQGLNVVVVAPSIVLGVGSWKSGSPKFFDFIHKGNKFYSSGGQGFVDVRDVAKALVQLSECKKAYGQKFLLSAENISFLQFFTSIAQHLGKPAPKYKAKYPLLLLAATLEQARCKLLRKEPNITFDSIKSGSRTTLYNGEKIKQYIPGFAYTPIEECIKFTAECYKKGKA